MAKKTNKTTSDQSDAEKHIIDAEIIAETPAEEVIEGADVLDAQTSVEQAEPEQDKDLADVAEDPVDQAAEPELSEADDQAEAQANSGEELVVDLDSVDEITDPEPEAAPANTPAPVVEKRVGFFPVFLGGVVAAAIGFGAAVILFPNGLSLSGDADPFEVATSQTLRDQAAEIAALREQIADFVHKTDLQAGLTDVTTGLSAAKTDLERLGATVGGFDARISGLEKRPLTEAISPAAIAAYEREVKALQDAVALQRAEAETMEGNARISARQALGRSALTRVVSALDSGEPYRAALVDLTSAFGITAPDALEALADDGVTTRSQLEDSYPVAARQALAVARKANREADGGSRLGTFLKNQLGARSVAPRDGEDPDAVLSRAEAALREGRLADSLIELQALPEIAAAEMTGWVAMAQTRAGALQAAETLAQSLNSN